MQTAYHPSSAVEQVIKIPEAILRAIGGRLKRK